MRQIYLEIVYNYGALVASIISLLFFLLLFSNLKKSIHNKIAFVLLFLTCLISLEFYSYQLLTFQLNIIIPLGVALVIFIKHNGHTSIKLINITIIIYSFYLILGLVFLSSSANTRGDGPAAHGVFIVCNSIMILLVLYTLQKKRVAVFIICQLLIALIGFLLIYYTTKGFQLGEYDVINVSLRRYSALLVCLVSLIISIIISLKKLVGVT